MANSDQHGLLLDEGMGGSDGPQAEGPEAHGPEADAAAHVARLEARVAMLEAVIDALPEPIFVKDQHHRFLLLNTSLIRLLRRDRADMLGKEDRNFFDEQAVAGWWGEDEQVLADGQVIEAVSEVKDAEGRPHVVSTRKGRATLPGGQHVVVGTIRDVTDAARAAARKDQDLSSALGTLEQLTAMRSMGVAHFDADGRFVYAFGPELRAMGITVERIAGAQYHQLAPLWPEAAPLIGDALAGQVRSAVLHWRGSVRHVTVTPAVGDDGSLQGATLISVDLTEQHDAERRAARTERMDSLGRLAGGVAHDLNNLLSVVMMGTSVLRDALAARDLDDAMVQVRVLERSIERGSRLSRQLASFARRQVGSTAIVDLHQHMRPVQVFVESLVGAEVTVRFLFGDGDPMVRLRPGQVEQLIINLVMHAAAGAGGAHRVDVETTCLDIQDDPELSPGPHVAIRVVDDSPPLPADARERMFEPFFDIEGRGRKMGLATCYGIAAQAGGRVRALAGQEGNVTEVLLPLADGPPTPEPVSKPVRPRRQVRLRVLVAEDEATQRSQLEQLLRTAGHDVVMAACDGVEAADFIAAHPGEVDVVVSDVVMPRMSGVDLALQLEGRIPVILMSGFVADGLERVPDLDARFNVLMKPVRPDELFRVLDEVTRS